MANKITVSDDGNNIKVSSPGPQGLPFSGGTMTGNIDMGGNSILNEPKLDAAIQPLDNVSELTNDVAYTSNGEDIQLTSLGEGDKFSSDDGTYRVPPQAATVTMRAEFGTAPPPSSGKIKWNNATQASATIIYLSETSDAGNDLSNYFSNLAVGDGIYLQNSSDAGNYQSWDVDVIVDSGGYKTLTVTPLQSAGPNFSTSGQGQSLLMTLQKGAGTIEALNEAASLGTESENDDRVDNTLSWLCGADSTGILTGGEVTINADPTKFDVSAGTGLIIDWQSPAAPIRKFIRWEALVGESVPNFASVFTSLYFDSSGTLIKDPAGIPDGNDFRNRIYLQSIVHQSGVQIDLVSSGSNPAYEVSAALYDYIRFLGPLNKGNCFSPNGVNLTFDKDAGQTALPFINRANDAQNPTVQTDSFLSPVTNFSYSYQDGASGWTPVFPNSVIDPNFWDDGSGTLNTVTNNRYTVQRLFWFPQSGTTTVTYGQAEYQTIQDAKDALLTENPNLDPIITNNGSFTALLIVQEGATDLSDPVQAEFVCRDA